MSARARRSVFTFRPSLSRAARVRDGFSSGGFEVTSDKEKNRTGAPRYQPPCGRYDHAGTDETARAVASSARILVKHSPEWGVLHEEVGDSGMERTFLSLDSSFAVFPSKIPPGSTVKVP